MNKKTIVFLSHIAEEKELASQLKALLEAAFLDLIDVFVSSEVDSVALGRKWLDEITTALRKCDIELILCSPKSVKRPWINFEAGGGWVRDIPVIPLCHSGIVPASLPLPLNYLQATALDSELGLKGVLATIASAMGASPPNIALSDFIAAVRLFERKYTFGSQVGEAVARMTGILNGINPAIMEPVLRGESVAFEITESDLKELTRETEFLLKNGLIRISRKGNVMVTTRGTFYDVRISPTKELMEAIKESA